MEEKKMGKKYLQYMKEETEKEEEEERKNE